VVDDTADHAIEVGPLTFDSSKSLRKPLGVAEVATRRDFRAASHRIPGRIRPFNLRRISHEAFRTKTEHSQGWTKLRERPALQACFRVDLRSRIRASTLWKNVSPYGRSPSGLKDTRISGLSFVLPQLRATDAGVTVLVTRCGIRPDITNTIKLYSNSNNIGVPTVSFRSAIFRTLRTKLGIRETVSFAPSSAAKLAIGAFEKDFPAIRRCRPLHLGRHRYWA
jgi:hypothetical protein